MQLVSAVQENVLESYIGGEIIISAHSNGSMMTRGILLEADVKGDWVPVKLKCLEFTPG